MAITDKYLKDPSAFPAQGDGEPWGDEELWIDFVGGPYRILYLSHTQRDRLRDHFADSCISAQPGAHTSISIRRISPDNFQDLGSGQREISFDMEASVDSVRLAGEHLCGLIELHDSTRGILWTDEDGPLFTRNVFENFFRVVVTYRLLEKGGLLLHSAGVVSHGLAFLFPGNSGDGKSTLSRLSLAEGKTVLSDDMNAITWRNGQPFVEKVPFSGDLGRTWSRSSSYPLAGLFAIKKSDTNKVSPLSPSRAVALMVSSAPNINGDRFRISLLLENLQRLTLRTPTHILDFSLSGNLWGTIEKCTPNLSAPAKQHESV